MSVHIKGHPIHPMLVAFPIGLFVTSFIFDLIATWSGGFGWYIASYYDLLFGIIFVLPTAIFGLADFLQIRDREAQKVGIYHMSYVVAAVVTFIISLLVRSVFAPGPTVLAAPVTGGAWLASLLLSAGGVTLLAYGGWYGAELVYRHKVGVGIEPIDRVLQRPTFGRAATSTDIAGNEATLMGDTPEPAPL
jgi:uncharacterized membrane protein